MRLRALVLVLAVLSPLGLAAGCGDDPKPATGPGLPSQAALKSYFEAIVSADADLLAKVQAEVTADASLAQAYAAYDGEFAAAAAAVDDSGDAPEAPDVEEVDGGFKACVGDSPGQCATWTDLEGKDGKLTDFDINGIELSELLVDMTGQRPIKSAGLYRLQPDYAYRQPTSGKLYVVCTLTAGDVTVAPKPGTYIEGERIFEGVKAPSPAVVNAGKSSPIVLAFEDAKDAELDGQVTFDLKIAGGTTESIGFGLADPVAS